MGVVKTVLWGKHSDTPRFQCAFDGLGLDYATKDIRDEMPSQSIPTLKIFTDLIQAPQQ
jgi:hypothetical protein